MFYFLLYVYKVLGEWQRVIIITDTYNMLI